MPSFLWTKDPSILEDIDRRGLIFDTITVITTAETNSDEILYQEKAVDRKRYVKPCSSI